MGEQRWRWYGVAGTSDQPGPNSIGVYGRGKTWAGKFDGNVEISGGLALDQQNANNGVFNNGTIAGDGLSFGGGGEGIASKRTAGGNQFGLDFYTGFQSRLSIGADGNVNVQGGDIRLTNSDCAEEFDVQSDTAEPGTVMILNQSGNLEESHQPYDKKVAGVVSGAGKYKPAIILDKKGSTQTHNSRLPIALMGKVYCKVDASHSSIEIGDLLTTSPTKGHAMKADDPCIAFGAVIGKALGSLKEGLGMLPVLVALQ